MTSMGSPVTLLSTTRTDGVVRGLTAFLLVNREKGRGKMQKEIFVRAILQAFASNPDPKKDKEFPRT